MGSSLSSLSPHLSPVCCDIVYCCQQLTAPLSSSQPDLATTFSGSLFMERTSWLIVFSSLSGPRIAGHTVESGELIWRSENDCKTQPFLNQWRGYGGRADRISIIFFFLYIGKSKRDVGRPYIYCFCDVFTWVAPELREDDLDLGLLYQLLIWTHKVCSLFTDVLSAGDWVTYLIFKLCRIVNISVSLPDVQ